MFTTRKGLLLIIILFLMTGAGSDYLKDFWKSGRNDPVITEKARMHILYGDSRGGGHMSGTDKPCKSEFPDDWSAEKIIQEVRTIAANDNLNWERQDNGYEKVDKMIEDVRIRVVVNPRSNEVVTAYPTNVGRNPCPVRKPTNDN